MGFHPSTPNLVASASGDTFSIRGWKVFDVGFWKGHHFGPDRIRKIIETFRYLKSILPGSYSPKLRLGHDRQQRVSKSLGLPNAGRIVDLRPSGSGFEVDIDGIPRMIPVPDGKGGMVAFDLKSAMANGNYDGGSVDMTSKMRDPANATRWLEDIFDGVALLGEEHPAVRFTGSPGDHIHSDADADVRLAFSDFTEESPVNPLDQSAPAAPAVTDTPATPNATSGDGMGMGGGDDDAQQLADAMHMDVNDPIVQQVAAIPGAVDAFMDSMNSNKFSAAMKTKYGAGAIDQTQTTAAIQPPMPPTVPGAVPMAAPTQEQFAAMAKKQDSLEKRCFAAEAALDDMRKQANGTAASGMMTMSEAHREIDHAVSEGRLPKVLADQYKKDATKLLTLPVSELCFSASDSVPENRGKAKVRSFIDSIKARPVDMMFAEQIVDAGEGDGEDIDGIHLSASDIDALSKDRNGRETLRFLNAKKAAIAAA